jgi:hypothetical protein
VVKSHCGERQGKRHGMTMSGEDQGGERKRTTSEVSK